MNWYTATKLRDALKIMRDACDRAEHLLKSEWRQPEEIVMAVDHELVWAAANAHSSIETAYSQCLRDRNSA